MKDDDLHKDLQRCLHRKILQIRYEHGMLMQISLRLHSLTIWHFKETKQKNYYRAYLYAKIFGEMVLIVFQADHKQLRR